MSQPRATVEQISQEPRRTGREQAGTDRKEINVVHQPRAMQDAAAETKLEQIDVAKINVALSDFAPSFSPQQILVTLIPGLPTVLCQKLFEKDLPFDVIRQRTCSWISGGRREHEPLPPLPRGESRSPAAVSVHARLDLVTIALLAKARDTV